MNKSDPPSEENIAPSSKTKKGRGRRFFSHKNKERKPKPNQEKGMLTCQRLDATKEVQRKIPFICT